MIGFLLMVFKLWLCIWGLVIGYFLCRAAYLWLRDDAKDAALAAFKAIWAKTRETTTYKPVVNDFELNAPAIIFLSVSGIQALLLAAIWLFTP